MVVLVCFSSLPCAPLATMYTPTIDPDSPLLVTKAIATLALLGAASGGTIAVLRAQPPLTVVLTMGLNGAVAGLSFFGESTYFFHKTTLC